MNLFLAALAHETNTFSPLPTTLRAFEAGIFYQGGQHDLQTALDFPGFGNLRDAAEARGDSVTLGPCYWAQPGGLVARAAWDRLRESVLASLRTAVERGAVDAVMLVLHGAMMAHGVDDCEGELLTRVRALVGPAVPVGVLLDLHGNLTPAMLASGALLIACKEYPHTDYPERAIELVTLLHAMREDGLAPRALMRPVPVLGLFGTTEGPMRALVDSLAVLEQRPGMLSISLMHGFAWSDAAATSAAVLVFYRPGHDLDAAAIARQVGAELFALRACGAAALMPLADAIDAALAHPWSGRPVVLADGADNPGGGAAGDSTFILRALIERRAQGAVIDAALGMLWDPQAVQIAVDAGIGATIALRIGGKVGPHSGDPVDVLATVTAVRDDARQHGLGGEFTEPLGCAVVLHVDGIDIVLNTIRQQVFSPECFTQLGIDLAARRLVVVKSTRHFRAHFDAIAARTLFCDTPGILGSDLARLPFRHIGRPIWPLDAIDAATTSEDVTA